MASALPSSALPSSALPSVLVLNGPNLGRLGVREPEIYGHASMADLEVAAAKWGEDLGLAIEVRQTDNESEIVGWLHEAVDAGAHVVLNPAAFTHYSYALRDAAAQVTSAGLLLVEVHLSNPATRESFRHYSVVAGIATGTVAGFGFDSYRLALSAIAERLRA
ncbi:type II 3-dehydroquinate dehydratase [Promicromonospora sukumoe]|uniref:type II 3-dehydroquinate dehydratase n=1 Tax=Promicromonospora sukumoe TaxID=88382 RepID=UPI0036605186